MQLKNQRGLDAKELAALHESLYYCKVGELRTFCEQLGIAHNGAKQVLITRITTFVETGTAPKEGSIPTQSRKQSGVCYPLHSDTVMVYGVFKNDAKTRTFLKSLIGNHFHYTVFGLDWLKQRWLLGNPPTYGEFVQFWQTEYLHRLGKQQELKPEWAYLNFMREFKNKYSTASKEEALAAWEGIRKQHKQEVLLLLKKYDQIAT